MPLHLFDAIFPTHVTPWQLQPNKHTHRFAVEDWVSVHILKNSRNVWCSGCVTKVIGPRNYIVILDHSGKPIKCHITQLKTTLFPKRHRKVSLAPLLSYNIPDIPPPHHYQGSEQHQAPQLEPAI